MYYDIKVNIRYSIEKDEILKEKRDISFKEIIHAIAEDKIVKIISNKEKFKHQKMMLLNIQNYIWAVPFVLEKNGIFLKTAFRSRKYTKKYLGGKTDEKEKK